MTARIARLKVTLNSASPQVVRRVEVPYDIRLDRLHDVVQAAFGWTNSHMWELRASDIRWGIPDPDWTGGPLNATKATLSSVVEDTGAMTLSYTYDFGDNWEHTIKIERIEPIQSNMIYPNLIEASGACPPEDIGGPPGYEEYLAAIADPHHERHAELTEYYPVDFDPNLVDQTHISARLATLAKRWGKKSIAKKSIAI
jgi:Plasmid pRiA4b ORF-3-like protein